MLHLSSRLHLCVVVGGFGEPGIHAGGSSSDAGEVGAKLGQFRGVGVEDPAVWPVGLLPAGQESLLTPSMDGAGCDA